MRGRADRADRAGRAERAAGRRGLPYSRDGTGLHRAVDPADGKVYCYTKFEPADARTVYANFEQPDLKASFTIHVIVPAHWIVLSNEPLEPEPVAGRRRVACSWRFEPTPRLSTYLFAIAAGEYQVVRATHTTPGGQVIPLGLACRASMAELPRGGGHARHHAAGAGLLHRAVRDRYPFAKYDQVFVPEYSVGATENAGCVIFTDQLLFRSKVTSTCYELRAERDPARDGAHVVRRPGHHAVVGRPVAERVVRRVSARRWPAPRRPATPAPGRPSPLAARRGATCRISCRPRIRSPPTWPP